MKSNLDGGGAWQDVVDLAGRAGLRVVKQEAILGGLFILLEAVRGDQQEAAPGGVYGG
jgi:hypothetical protein